MDVSKLYTKVEEALKRKNYDYAIETLKNQILKFNPNDVKARKLLRATVLEKHKAVGVPNKSEILSKGMMPRIKMIVGKIAKKWDMVVDEAENYLLYDPKNFSVLYALGEACVQAQYIDTAISVFESILAFEASHVNALKALGKVYHLHKEDLEKAQQYIQRAARLAPNDIELAKLAKNLSAEITSSQYGQAKSSQDLIKDKEKARELEEDQAMLRTEEDIKRAIERSQKRLEQDPESKKELRRLGDLYQKLGSFEDAVSTYQKVLKLDPTSFDVKCKISDCRIQKATSRIRTIKQKAKQAPNDERLKKELQKAMQAKNQVEVTEYREQVEAQPTNYDLRFRLGAALFQGNMYDEAIAQFQSAVKDPRRKIAAYTYMGQAFTKRKEYDLAVEQFQNALNSLSPKDRLYKDTLYHLGMAYEAADQRENALDTFMSIYKEDINYRDVKDRVKKLKV